MGGRERGEHKDMKGLSSHNLRDHMSEAELIFTALAELSTRQIAESAEATGMAPKQDLPPRPVAALPARRAAVGKPNRQVGGDRRTGANFLTSDLKKIAGSA
jgi:DNA-damage-inducible protein D